MRSLLAFLLLLSPEASFASTMRDYGKPELALLNAMANCSAEFREAMSGNTGVVKASLAIPRPVNRNELVQSYEVVFANRSADGLWEEVKQTVLTVREKSVKGRQATYTCKLTRN